MPRDDYDDEDDREPPRRRPARRDDRDDRDADDDRDRPLPKKKGSNVLLIVGIILGSLFLVCGGAGAAVYFFVIKPAAAKVREVNDRVQADIAERQKQIEKEQQTAGKVWNLNELDEQVRDKTPAQVRDLLGPPSETRGNVEKDPNAGYVYYNRARIGTRTTNVEVQFRNGVCVMAVPRAGK